MTIKIFLSELTAIIGGGEKKGRGGERLRRERLRREKEVKLKGRKRPIEELQCLGPAAWLVSWWVGRLTYIAVVGRWPLSLEIADWKFYIFIKYSIKHSMN